MSIKEVLLTYVIPAYNVENVLEPCINSIIQIGDDVEIIIVDDGSTDGTINVAKDLYEKYPGQIVVIEQANRGVSEARNTGISSAHGKYLAFSDADDTINTEEVKRVLSENNMLEDIVMFNYSTIENGVKKQISLFHDLLCANCKDSLLNHLLYCRFSRNDDDLVIGGKVWQYFWKKEFLNNNMIRFDSTLHYAEDLVFCCLAITKAKKIIVHNISIYNYYVIIGTASHRYRENYWHELQDVYNALKQICPDYMNDGMYYYYARTVLFHISEYAESKIIPRNIALEKFCEVLSDRRVHDDFESVKNRRWIATERITNYLMDIPDNGKCLYYYLSMIKKIKKATKKLIHREANIKSIS